ncbi:hypothetical protein CONPUDRAFT_165552 [Coniophora puteana RWD-64-598 SS2]|uniref:DUF6534 domain-containing protein n=1 Tax=Coniophora puteana (strain RWD-64-598) TaxID=741705 RepID=A0A5M3MQR2_CONPW|nr:uncharacterized protein CONPUDRAFT_165552 [Coniophora puteana RWD-64-598 SS2]EIW81396.1 hypothetical protein CONPUDRAFT_165552 [Coniophora puteana RWD-64-598 SS2]
MSSSATPAPSSAEIENLGIIFIGFVAAIILYGLTFFQAYIYFSRFPKDSYYLRLMVGTLCLLDTASSALISEVVYHYLITQFMVQMDTIYATTTLCVELLLSTILTFIVHLFFVLRVYAVSSRSRPLSLSITFFAFVAFVFGITMSAQIYHQRNLADLAQLHERAVVIVAQAAAGAADLVICGAMVFYMRPARFPDVFMPESTFETAVTLFASRGIGFTVLQIGYLVVFAAIPSKALWIPIQLVASKFYINTVLALLNAREARHGLGIYEEESNATGSSTPAGRPFSGATPPVPSTIRFAGLSSKEESRLHHGIEGSGEVESMGKYEDEPERHNGNDTSPTTTTTGSRNSNKRGPVEASERGVEALEIQSLQVPPASHHSSKGSMQEKSWSGS